MEGYLGEIDVTEQYDISTKEMALKYIEMYGGIDGAHHKDWLHIKRFTMGLKSKDIVRIYEKLIKELKMKVRELISYLRKFDQEMDVAIQVNDSSFAEIVKEENIEIEGADQCWGFSEKWNEYVCDEDKVCDTEDTSLIEKLFLKIRADDSALQ